MTLISPNLEAFLAVTSSGSVHAASKVLRLTQTGVTQRIRSLERHLEVTLFIRSRKGMQPTREGEVLLRYCRSVVEMQGETLAQIQSAGIKRAVQVSVTGPTSLFESRVTGQCISVLRKMPFLKINFVVNDLRTRIDDLRTGKMQMALIPPEWVSREMDSKLLRPEKYLLVGTSRWKKRRLEDILTEEKIIDYDSGDETTFRYLESFGLLKSASAERHFVNNNTALLNLFFEGIGYGVLSAEVAEPHLSSGKLFALNSGAGFSTRTALAWYPRPEMPAYFKALIRAIA